MVKKNLYGTVDLKPMMKREQSVLVEYYMTEREEEDENYNCNRPYGIEVVKKQMIDGVTYREVKRVNDISNSMEQVNNLLALLQRNSVTPIAVGDVLEDLAVK